ncbi:MAG: amidase family protein, partial [Acidimicrobiia bacterium]|nr:amidase family protein [Acidimicrobiia bacterium]
MITIAEAGKRLRSGSLTAASLIEDVLARASRTEAELHSYLTIDHEGARRSAAEADACFAKGDDAGPLQGIPIAL